MGWFDAVYGRPGRGVEPNAPRKRGLARFAEIVGRDLGALLGCNLLCCLLCLPAALLVSLGVVLQQFWLTLGCAALAGAFLGPALRLLACCVLRSLRDDPAPWLPAAWAALKQDWKRTLGFGVLTAELAALALFFLEILSLATAAGAFPALPVLVFFGIDALALAMAGCLLWAVLPLDAAAPGGGMLRLLLRGPGRCLAAALAVLADLAAVAALFPVSVFWCVLAGFWLPALAAGLLLYPLLERQYSLPRCAPRTPFEAGGSRPLTSAEQKKRRAANWWYYHWGMVAAGALVVLGVVYVGRTLLTAVDPDESVAIVTAEALPDAALAALQEELAGCAADRNGDGRVVVEVNNYTWAAAPDALHTDAQTAGAVRINTDLVQGISSIWFVEDPDAFEEAYGVFSENNIQWHDTLVYGADLHGLMQLPDGALLADQAVLLRGDATPLWQALVVNGHKETLNIGNKAQ